VSWRDRIRQITLAGGALSLASCGDPLGLSGVPCGNANPDPCICGRPESSAESKAQCDAKHACQAAGGVWDPYYVNDQNGTTPPHCEFDGGAADAAPTSDADSDGG
jgi:hypothetical protein